MVEESKIFIDRRDAGYELGILLESQYKDQNVLVLGIPRGGVEVAFVVAQILNGQLSVVVTKKLPHPRQEELAVGAVAEDGSVYLTALGKSLREETISQIIKTQSAEIKSRIKRFRQGKALPDMEDRIVIIVDDGIATGSTIVPAIKLCRANHAREIVVAAPVSGKLYVSEINELADAVFVVERPQNFYAVGQVYEDFHNLSDEEVVALLTEFEHHSE